MNKSKKICLVIVTIIITTAFTIQPLLQELTRKPVSDIVSDKGLGNDVSRDVYPPGREWWPGPGSELDTQEKDLWMNFGTEDADEGELNLSKLLTPTDAVTPAHIPEMEGRSNFTTIEWHNYSGAPSPPYPGPPPSPPLPPAALGIEIEEPDIVKTIGTRLFVLNPYRGLFIINASNTTDKYIEGTVAVLGYPQQMYVVDFLVFVIVNTDTIYWHQYLLNKNDSKNCTDDIPPELIGGKIYVINVADPCNPKIAKRFDLPGYCLDSRRVGTTIYTVTCTYNYGWWHSDMSYTSDRTYIASISFSDPGKVRVIDRVEFPGTADIISVSADAIFVANTYIDPTCNQSWWPYRYLTTVNYVDISDREGEIVIRGNYTVTGFLSGKYWMDYWNGMLRMVTHFWETALNATIPGYSVLTVLNVSTPDTIWQMGNLTILDAGTLMAVRFAETRAYTIHLPRSVDPLDVIDLSDPYNPELCDVLEMPGWITHMEVRGDKILALGVDDSNATRKVAMSLFDVSDPYNAVMIQRVTIGEEYSWSGATWEPKCLSIIDSCGLAFVPYVTMTNDYSEIYCGMQVVRFSISDVTLELCGNVTLREPVERTRLIGNMVACVGLGSVYFVNISNLYEISLESEIPMIESVVSQHIMGDYIVQLRRKTYDDSYYISTVDEKNPNTMTPLATLKIGSAYIVNCFPEKDHMHVASLDIIHDSCDYSTGNFTYRIITLDYTNPLAPIISGSLEFKESFTSYFRLSSEIMFDNDILILSLVCHYPVMERRLIVIDTENTHSDPILASDFSYIDNAYDWWFYDRAGFGDGLLYYSQYRHTSVWIDNDTEVVIRGYYLKRVSLLDPYNPLVLPDISIPEPILAMDTSRSIAYVNYNDWQDYSTYKQYFIILSVGWDNASIVSCIDMCVNQIFLIPGTNKAVINAHFRITSDPYYYYDNKLMLMDLSNSVRPLVLCAYNLTLPGPSLKVNGNYVILDYWNAFILFAIEGDDLLPMRGWLTYGGIYDVMILDEHAYVAKGYRGVWKYDI